MCFSDKIYLVSGAGQGIGLAVCEALIGKGASVFAIDLKDERLKSAADRLGESYWPERVDVSEHEAVEAAVERAVKRYGRIDGLVNAAGLLRMGTLTDLSEQDWRATFAVNSDGIFSLSTCVARQMKRQGGGVIVTVASNASGTPRHSMGAYAASKAAAVMITKTLGLELAGDHIRCNIVSPGSTDTAMQRQLWVDENGEQAVIDGDLTKHRLGIPLGKIAQPDDVAGAVLFMLSDRAGHITMQEICVDGGATLGS
ncbi:MAG: 2,3-dihydro-2,3-dihydroxybenzoate dehydrogenase [Hyphomicrobiales bacterium]|nr:2,3-dihydro-2,3-dihydroxybenzoate dehydrogenase [Hyphomicrobiales bacterium]